MREAQKKVERFIEEHGLSTGEQVRLLDLVSELGELSKEILKASAYGERPTEPTAELKEELGDCLFSLLGLSCALRLDAGDALEGALAKYRQRIADHGDAGSGR